MITDRLLLQKTNDQLVALKNNNERRKKKATKEMGKIGPSNQDQDQEVFMTIVLHSLSMLYIYSVLVAVSQEATADWRKDFQGYTTAQELAGPVHSSGIFVPQLDHDVCTTLFLKALVTQFNKAFGIPLFILIGDSFLMSVSLFFGFIWAAEERDYKICALFFNTGLCQVIRWTEPL